VRGIAILAAWVALLGVIVAGLLVGGPKRRARRALRRLPLTPIADAAAGAWVRVGGTVEVLGAPLRAPLSGRACAYYEVRVEQKISAGRSTRWITRAAEADGREFAVRDAGGRAIVRLREAELALVDDIDRRSGLWREPTPDLEAFLAARGIAGKGRWSNPTLRYREAVLEPGEVVGIAGLASREPAPTADGDGGGYRDAPTVLVLASTKGRPLIVTDAPLT
jgi:hypothetical protein